MSQATILIKNKSGQLKAVDLASAGIQVKQQMPTMGVGAGQASDKQQAKEKIHEQEVNSMAQRKTEENVELKKETEEILKPMAKEMTMPAFYFHREDEEEAAQYKSQANLKQAEDYRDLVLHVVEQIMNDSRVVVERGARERLVRAMESRLREVRDLLETKEVLIRPANLGGVGLDKESAGRVMRVMEEYRLQLFEKKEKSFLEKRIEPKEVKNETPLIEKSEQQPLTESQEIKWQQSAENLKVEPTTKTISATKQLPVNVQKVIEVAPPIATKLSYAETVTQSWTADKTRSRLMGPTEELGSITLENFRAWGKNIKEIMTKIKDKIDLLTDESYEKRAEGINHWRLSPVYQEYLMIGRKSVETGQGVEDVINQKQMAHQPTLTLEEFQAIADLNEELTY
ncbi:MAG TPA: hypothetical protein PKZ16_01945 [bacterium]|nr:hypothetical protein [bacterium]HPL95782.1 hypothetical protein [bacterium]